MLFDPVNDRHLELYRRWHWIVALTVHFSTVSAVRCPSNHLSFDSTFPDDHQQNNRAI